MIITFLEDEPGEIPENKTAEDVSALPHDPTDVFLSKCGGWEDTRSPEEIIAEIYASRTTSEKGAQGLQGEA